LLFLLLINSNKIFKHSKVQWQIKTS
jgi:hypothetical protein